MKVINLFAGPGAGKSTTAAGLFHLMKLEGFKVELVVEYAKEVTYDEQYHILHSDQLYITAKQNRRLERLRNHVDWVITDSPLLLGIVYKDPEYLPNTYSSLVKELFNTYDNENFFIARTKEYVNLGRNETELQAHQKDEEIINLLEEHMPPYYSIPYTRVNGDKSAPQTILNFITAKLES